MQRWLSLVLFFEVCVLTDISAPKDNPVPLGVFVLFTLAVFADFVGGKCQEGDGGAVFRLTEFRIRSMKHHQLSTLR